MDERKEHALPNKKKNFFSTGHAILSMLIPDSDLPTQYLIQGNVILLFNNDYHIRQDAVAALMYLLLDQEDADLYLPNIQNITDVIPSNICILDNVVNPKQKVITGVHEVIIFILIRAISFKTSTFSAAFNALFN